MTGKYEIIFSGVGGQGLLLAANILGKAAAIQENKQAVMSCAYGTESRGTFTKADLVISDQPIDFPEVMEADAVVALAQVAYDRYCKAMKPGSVLIYDSVSVQKRDSVAAQYGLPLSDIAEKGGNKGSLNVASVGAVLALTDCVAVSSVQAVLAEQFKGKAKVIKINKQILQDGYDLAAEMLT